MKHYASIVDALQGLKDRGYEADFESAPFCLYCGDLDLRLNPDQFTIDEIYRFDEVSSPDENAILYAISSVTGVKGTLIDRLEYNSRIWECQNN